MSFARGAARLAGLAARVLGWRPEEFWRATPAELALSLGVEDADASPPSPTRADLKRMMERDGDGRSDR